jgi:hypothetical protein
MSVSTIIDDIANRRHLSEVLALAGKGEIEIGRLRRMAYGLRRPSTSSGTASIGC